VAVWQRCDSCCAMMTSGAFAWLSFLERRRYQNLYDACNDAPTLPRRRRSINGSQAKSKSRRVPPCHANAAATGIHPADICNTENEFAHAPAYHLTQLSSGLALCADAHTGTTSCGSAGCDWHLRAAIGLPDRCYLIANGQFLDGHGE
jgi:hypothetical protein